jgi:protein-tyrosine phosphatase
MKKNIVPFERSYWVIPNKLLAGEIPSSKDEQIILGKISGLINVGINIIINLVEKDEKNFRDEILSSYEDILNELNPDIKVFNFPIRDLDIPSKELMRTILFTIDTELKNKNKVYVHCWGGIGRTGTVIGCFLKEYGYSIFDDPIETIDYLKRTTSISDRDSPETRAQREFVRNW